MKTKDEIWDECFKKCSTLRETWRMAMEEYASQSKPKLTGEKAKEVPSDEDIKEWATSQIFRSDHLWDIKSLIAGAKAMRDGKIKIN